MSAIPQQVFATQKAALDNLLAFQGTVFEGFEKLVDLNLKVVKASLEEAAQRSQEAIQVKDAQEAVAFTSGLVQPGAEKALAYGKHVYDIVSSVQSDLSHLAEKQMSQGREQFADAIEQFAKSAPTGSESAIALLKSSLATASNAYDSVSKAAKQATQAAESNLAAAANATLQAASNAAEAVKPTTTRSRRAAA